MKVCVIGGGFTGLTAALRLIQRGHDVLLIEKEGAFGGLATGFREKGWKWSVERAYHHWFINDRNALTLARELNHPTVIKRPRTDIFVEGERFQFDSPLSLLAFPHLSLVDKLRVGSATLYLKMLNDYKKLERQKALPWTEKWMGRKAFEMIWDPLFTGKFGTYKQDVSLTWFWARIKKRTEKLAYPEGGFETFAKQIKDAIEKLGGKLLLNTTVTKIKNSNRNISIKWQMTDGRWEINNFDRVIVTLPSPIFARITEGLPEVYIKRLTSIKHLHALNLILILKKPFMEETYWLNITDKTFPFLVLVEHTNFIDPKYYGGNYILYIGNYLPRDHPYFKMTKEEILKEFTPYLQKINPDFQLSSFNYQLFTGPFAQPIVTVDYKKHIPTFETPIKNVFLANLDMVYPWDRGTNYAIELGEKVAELIL